MKKLHIIPIALSSLLIVGVVSAQASQTDVTPSPQVTIISETAPEPTIEPDTVTLEEASATPDTVTPSDPVAPTIIDQPGIEEVQPPPPEPIEESLPEPEPTIEPTAPARTFPPCVEHGDVTTSTVTICQSY